MTGRVQRPITIQSANMRATISTIFTVCVETLGNFTRSTLLGVARSLDTCISPLLITLLSCLSIFK